MHVGSLSHRRFSANGEILGEIYESRLCLSFIYNYTQCKQNKSAILSHCEVFGEIRTHVGIFWKRSQKSN
jgi:hypothetical protein